MRLRSRGLRADDAGAVMAEYVIMATLIAVVVAVAVGPLGNAVSTLFTQAVAAF